MWKVGAASTTKTRQEGAGVNSQASGGCGQSSFSLAIPSATEEILALLRNLPRLADLFLFLMCSSVVDENSG